MVSKILETNVSIEYLRKGFDETKQKINNLIEEGFDLKITQITACELWYGVYRLPSKAKCLSEAKKLTKFFKNLTEILTMDNLSSKIYGEICAELDKKGKRVPQFDLIIASIAIANKTQLITKDKRHFPRINALSEYDFLDLWETE
ncbi:MAG: type II toxin-antitoxin system VapC family toxin [Promethearchaeota archaeon]